MIKYIRIIICLFIVPIIAVSCGLYLERPTNDPIKVLTLPDPWFNPLPDDYDTTVDVVITCRTEDAIIYYTLDGSAPTETNFSGTGIERVVVSVFNKTLKAIVIDGYNSSKIKTGIYE